MLELKTEDVEFFVGPRENETITMILDVKL